MAQNEIGALSGLFGSSNAHQGSDNMSMAMPMGSNQYGSYPSLSPGIVPTQPSLPGSSQTSIAQNNGAPLNYIVGAPGSANEIPGTNSKHLEPTYDPAFTQQFYNMLTQQLGQGLPGFNLSTALPGGGNTEPGQLNAPLNSTLQDIQKFLAGGQTNIPGANQLTQMSQTGNPIDQTPAWQAMIAAEQQNTDMNAANLREQFAFGGNLKSSPFGSAMQQFYNQNALNQNAQLTQATATAQENAMNRQLQAGQDIQGEAQQFGTGLQNNNQQAIQNMLNEFHYMLPQNNPMNQMFQQSALSSPNIAETPTSMQNISSFINSIGSLF